MSTLEPLSAPRWLIPAIAWLLVLCGCREGQSEATDEGLSSRVKRTDGALVLSAAQRAAVGLETASVVQGSVTTSALRFGKVVGRPQEDALVAAPVTGRLVAPTLVLGASVSTGDVLIALEPLVDAASRATSEAQRRELQGQIEAARAQVEARQVAMRRMSTLVASGLATEAERAQAEAELTAERARVDSLRRASDELARMTGGRIELRAPVAGVVALLLTGAGSVVPQGEIVARIVKAGPRWIDLAVPPADPVGSGYRVQGLSDVVAARLVTRGAFIQSDGTRRDRLEVSEDAASNLPPGATLPVEVLHETTGLVVPLNALVRHAHKALVFVQVEPGRYESREVQVGARADERAVVTSGLSAGANVVAQGAPSLLGELVADVEGGREADE